MLLFNIHSSPDPSEDFWGNHNGFVVSFWSKSDDYEDALDEIKLFLDNFPDYLSERMELSYEYNPNNSSNHLNNNCVTPEKCKLDLEGFGFIFDLNVDPSDGGFDVPALTI